MGGIILAVWLDGQAVICQALLFCWSHLYQCLWKWRFFCGKQCRKAFLLKFVPSCSYLKANNCDNWEKYVSWNGISMYHFIICNCLVCEVPSNCDMVFSCGIQGDFLVHYHGHCMRWACKEALCIVYGEASGEDYRPSCVVYINMNTIAKEKEWACCKPGCIATSCIGCNLSSGVLLFWDMNPVMHSHCWTGFANISYCIRPITWRSHMQYCKYFSPFALTSFSHLRR